MSGSPLIPPQSTPRKLYRSRNNRMIGGVCGGVADYLNLDPTIVRVITVLLTLFTGVPVVVYLVALLVVPEEPLPPERDERPRVTGPVDPVWGTAGAPWEQPMDNPAGGPTARPANAGRAGGTEPASGAPSGATADQPGEPTSR
jgi:phage shock protein C